MISGSKHADLRMAAISARPGQGIPRFWIEKARRKRQQKCAFLIAKPYEGPATKSGLRNPPMQNIFIGLSCGADQCGFN